MAAYEAGQIDADGFKAVQGALITHCELLRYRFVVLDGTPPPADVLAEAGIEYVFGISGGHTGRIISGLAQVQNRTPVRCNRSRRRGPGGLDGVP